MTETNSKLNKAKLNKPKLEPPGNSEVGKRIKKLIEDKKLTQKEVADKLDITEATLSRYINGQRKPTGDTLIQLSSLLETTTDYILKGKKETTIIKPKPIKVNKEIKIKLNTLKSTKTDLNKMNTNSDSSDVDLSTLTKLDIIGSVRAGVGGIAYEDNMGTEYAYTVNASKETHFYLKVKGDSMEPKISEGDLALVKKQSDVESGDLAIVLVNNEEGVIKKVIKKPTSIELHSFNPYYPTRVFAYEEMNSIKIIGKVLKIISSW